MIKCAGYTDDGFVFFVVSVKIDGKMGDLTIRMAPEDTKKLITDLQVAVDKATETRVIQ